MSILMDALTTRISWDEASRSNMKPRRVSVLTSCLHSLSTSRGRHLLFFCSSDSLKCKERKVPKVEASRRCHRCVLYTWVDCSENRRVDVQARVMLPLPSLQMWLTVLISPDINLPCRLRSEDNAGCCRAEKMAENITESEPLSVWGETEEL